MSDGKFSATRASQGPGRIEALAGRRADPLALAAIDRIFFSSSTTQTFASAEERAAFRERWLGRYLDHFSDCCFVALEPSGAIIGYLVGSLDDPARDPLFADQAHLQAFAHVTPRYPAQLHVNLDEAWRGRGVGSALIAAFKAHASALGAAGVHVVTSHGMRNVGFYAANGFHERARALVAGKDLVLLGAEV